MRRIFFIAIQFAFLPSLASAANFPDCSVLAAVDWPMALSSNDSSERALGMALVEFEEHDFENLKETIQKCANEAPGERFGQYNKSYLAVSIFPLIDEAKTSLPRLREQYEAEQYAPEAQADLEWYLDKVTTVGEDGKRGVLSSDDRQIVNDYMAEVEQKRSQSMVWASQTLGLIELGQQILEKADEAEEFNASVDVRKQKEQAAAQQKESELEDEAELNRSNASSIRHHANLQREGETLQQLFLTYLTGRLCASYNASYTTEEVSSIEAEIQEFVKTTPLEKAYRDKLWSASTQAIEMYQHKFGTGDCAVSRVQAMQMFPKIFQDPDKLAEENPF